MAWSSATPARLPMSHSRGELCANCLARHLEERERETQRKRERAREQESELGQPHPLPLLPNSPWHSAESS